jgi:1-deoxy-D-xylulose-5-phosphate synthase
MVEVALEAAEILFKDEGLSVSVIDARFVKPLDIELIREVFTKTNIIFTIEDSVLAAGFGSSILEIVSGDEALREKNNALHILGFTDGFISHGKRDILLDIYGLSPKAVAVRIKSQFMAARHQQNFR